MEYSAILAYRRIGETRKMNNGMLATIIEYINYADCTIQFEDGTIIEHKTYQNFRNGKIANPNTQHATRRHPIDPANHIGESRQMNNGMTATIAEYTSGHGYTIQFEDGAIVKHKSYRSFLKGNIANTNLATRNLASERIGESRQMNNGMTATIVEYANRHDFTVQFEDGTIVEHRNYRDFQKGNIANPNNAGSSGHAINPTRHIGEKKIMNNGMAATIIECGKYKDCTVQFEDRTIVKHKSYNEFQKGSIANPNIKNTQLENNKKERIGERRLMNCGLYATLMEYNGKENCTIRFKDGAIVKNARYYDFNEITGQESPDSVRRGMPGTACQRHTLRVGRFSGGGRA